mmetsp:Transcript_7498/g.19570  ORF Transcript_7498/g.19570 Transcript_7498/m.19570 type:complete len:323 (-) Transcript_7498:1522-2490(-)
MVLQYARHFIPLVPIDVFASVSNIHVECGRGWRGRRRRCYRRRRRRRRLNAAPLLPSARAALPQACRRRRTRFLRRLQDCLALQVALRRRRTCTRLLHTHASCRDRLGQLPSPPLLHWHIRGSTARRGVCARARKSGGNVCTASSTRRGCCHLRVQQLFQLSTPLRELGAPAPHSRRGKLAHLRHRHRVVLAHKLPHRARDQRPFGIVKTNVLLHGADHAPSSTCRGICSTDVLTQNGSRYPEERCMHIAASLPKRGAVRLASSVRNAVVTCTRCDDAIAQLHGYVVPTQFKQLAHLLDIPAHARCVPLGQIRNLRKDPRTN